MNFKDSNTLQIGISSETSPHSNRTIRIWWTNLLEDRDRKQTQQRPGSWGATTTTSWGQILPWSSSCSSETVSDGAILLFFSSLLLCNYLLFLLLHGGRELGFLGWWAQESQTLREAWKHWLSEFWEFPAQSHEFQIDFLKALDCENCSICL